MVNLETVKAAKVKTETVPVPEWGGDVVVYQMTGKERDEYDAAIYDNDGNFIRAGSREKLIVATVRDESGKPIFTNSDLSTIADQPAAITRKICQVAIRLNGLGRDEQEQKKSDSEDVKAG